MEQKVPDNISTRWNRPVLDFVREFSAHSDVTEALLRAVKPLGDVQYYCPDPSRYRYLLVSTKTIMASIAIGSRDAGIFFRREQRVTPKLPQMH